MKKLPYLQFLFIAFFMAVIFSCSKETTQEPCDGKGTLNVENKLDTTITVKIVQTRLSKDIPKDYTVSIPLTGNQPYTLNISSSDYSMDTTIMLLSCDNKLFVVIK